MADKNGLELRIRTCLYHIKTDPVLLSTMLRNLIQNALLYTKKGKVLISCRKKGNKILIQVWDTGRGIAEENQHIIFEEFQQLNNPERDQNKGLGLGLSICKRLADLLKIDFSLKSQLGKGSVFSLEIPILSDAKVEALSSQKVPFKLLDENPKYHEQVILLIDDNSAVIEAMTTLLENWGCTVLKASSVEETVVIAKDYMSKVDIIIADYRLRKDTTGVEAIEAFNRYSGYSVPSLLLTGDTSPEIMREVSAHGLPVLHKPIKEPQLKVVIARLLRISS